MEFLGETLLFFLTLYKTLWVGRTNNKVDKAQALYLRAECLHEKSVSTYIDYIISTAELAGISQQAIGLVVCSLQGQGDDIIAALDLLFLGF